LGQPKQGTVDVDVMVCIPTGPLSITSSQQAALTIEEDGEASPHSMEDVLEAKIEADNTVAGIAACCGGVPNVKEDTAGAVGLLICEVFGGFLPKEVVDVNTLELRVAAGKSHQKSPCQASDSNEDGLIGEKTRKIIERLALRNLTAAEIAHVTGENATDVQRVMRRRGNNFECSQKVCVMLRASDLASLASVHLTLVNAKGKLFAAGAVKFENIMNAKGKTKQGTAWYCEVVPLLWGKDLKKGEDTAPIPAIEGKPCIDIEFRLYAIVENVGRTTPGVSRISWAAGQGDQGDRDDFDEVEAVVEDDGQELL